MFPRHGYVVWSRLDPTVRTWERSTLADDIRKSMRICKSRNPIYPVLNLVFWSNSVVNQFHNFHSYLPILFLPLSNQIASGVSNSVSKMPFRAPIVDDSTK